MANLNLPDQADLKPLLDHARGLFQYHAGQRHDSIRNFFIAFGVFLTAEFSARSINVSFIGYARLLLDITVLVVTLVFWVLDFRNAQMVDMDEAALKEIEKDVSDKYGLQAFNLSATWKREGQFRRYGNMMKITFGYFTVLFLFLLAWDVYSLMRS